jgi:hypothetical protein
MFHGDNDLAQGQQMSRENWPDVAVHLQLDGEPCFPRQSFHKLVYLCEKFIVSFSAEFDRPGKLFDYCRPPPGGTELLHFGQHQSLNAVDLSNAFFECFVCHDRSFR